MTDKEIVERAKEAEKRTGFGELVHSPISKGVNSAYGIGFIEGMVEYRDSLQEEPITSVWHDISEKPKMNSIIVINNSQTTLSVEYVGQSLCGVERWAYLDILLKL